MAKPKKKAQKAAKKVATKKKQPKAKASPKKVAKDKPKAKKAAPVLSPKNEKKVVTKPPAPIARKRTRGIATLVTATIDVIFTNTNPGLSRLVGTCNGLERVLTQSGAISFPNVGSGDIILIQVDSLGSTTATIDISATPTNLNFAPGVHSGTFFIN